MACPTCHHTMHNIGEHFFWCPRCGTLVMAGGLRVVDRPSLVETIKRAAGQTGRAAVRLEVSDTDPLIRSAFVGPLCPDADLPLELRRFW